MASRTFMILPESSANCAGVSDCAPSHSAWMGSLCTSTMMPSALGGRRGKGHRGDEPGKTGRVAGVDDDRQVRELMEHRHGGKVERISRVGLECADAALAEDDLLVAAGHDILCAHEKLLHRGGDAAL